MTRREGDCHVHALLCLCTTGSAAAPKARACEMSARRCRPAGQLLFLEHVRDEDPRIVKKQDNPAIPLLLDGVPSEPSHPGRDHRFEAVCRGRSPWCGPEGIRDRAADGARPSHAQRRWIATGRNTHAMTFTPAASWCRPADGNHSQEIVSATT